MAIQKTPQQLAAEQQALKGITLNNTMGLPQGMNPQLPAGLVGLATSQPGAQAAPAIPNQQTYQMPMQGGLVGAPVDQSMQQVQMREVNPIYRTVQNDETVMGQLDKVMGQDSTLLQRARARAAAGMAGRGLTNSSMAIGAGEAAMYDVAMPIASQDANTYGAAALANQQEGNETQRFNATQFNAGSMFNAGETNKMTMLNTQEAGADRRLSVTEKGQMDRLNISEAGQNRRSDAANATTLTATKMNNDTQRYSTDVNASTQRYATDVGASVSRENARLAADTQKYTANLSASTQQAVAGMQIEAQKSVTGAQLWNSTQSRISEINANPDYDKDTRERLVQNQLDAAQQGINIANGAKKINLAVSD